MHRDAPFHLHFINLLEFLRCQFQLKVTILRMGVQPCPTFIRVNECALVRPKIIHQYRETKKNRPHAEGTLQIKTTNYFIGLH